MITSVIAVQSYIYAHKLNVYCNISLIILCKKEKDKNRCSTAQTNPELKYFRNTYLYISMLYIALRSLIRTVAFRLYRIFWKVA